MKKLRPLRLCVGSLLACPNSLFRVLCPLVGLNLSWFRFRWYFAWSGLILVTFFIFPSFPGCTSKASRAQKKKCLELGAEQNSEFTSGNLLKYSLKHFHMFFGFFVCGGSEELKRFRSMPVRAEEWSSDSDGLSILLVLFTLVATASAFSGEVHDVD